ncbi:T9SS type A sorting domain-containing protein [candidate division TA06 bacterium]|uniref:T9SS type A sorting domain-containing protein n=1 Tax=candidate division TA06 bacterium TaxID=2250710 RepID=A0A523UXB2_UNCT6|nr:MAG: T9SS type A sorting domain-containing protein [candidate division TA06 bacterium]
MSYKRLFPFCLVILWAACCAGAVLYPVERVQGGPPAENFLFFPTPTPDTIYYDDGTGAAYYPQQHWDFAVRFTPVVGCTLKGASVANYQVSVDSCSLFVWADDGGEPGTLLHAPIPYLGLSFTFRQVDLDSALFIDTDFWIGYYAPGPPFCLMDAISSSPIRSFYRSLTNWYEINAGDLLVRALVDYGGVTIRDVGVRGVRTTGGFFMRNPASSTPWAVIENLGDSTEYNLPVECSIIDTSYTASVVYIDTQFVDEIAPGDLDTVYFQIWNPVADGEYIITTTTLLPGDMITDNDVAYLETQVCSPPRAALTYDDDDYDGSFTGVPNNAWATEYVPPWYPCLVESVKIYFGSSGDPVVMWVLDDDGPWHLPGTVWYAETTSVSSSGWHTFNTYLKAPVFDDGKFYIAYWYNTGAPSLAYDSDLPIANQTWRFQTAWVKDNSNDWMMRAYVSMVEKHDAAVTDILAPADTLLTDSTYDIGARLANFGNMTDTINAFCTIDGYADTLQFPDVTYGQTVDAWFAQWTVPHTDSFVQVDMTVFVTTYDDRNPENDTLKKTIVYGPPVGVAESELHRESPLPMLGQNNPNPFSNSTNIQVLLPEGALSSSFEIYDAAGRLIKQVDLTSTARTLSVIWDGKTDRGDYARSGVYFYKLRFGNSTLSRKMILIR